MITSGIFGRVRGKESKMITCGIFQNPKIENENRQEIGVYENGVLLEIYRTDCSDVVSILEAQARDYVAFLSKKNHINKYSIERLDL